MSQLVTTGFHHVTLVCRDARKTLRFYRDILGLALVKVTVNFDRTDTYHLYFGNETAAPGSLLTFFEWPQAMRGRYGVGGIHHVALGTKSDDTLPLSVSQRFHISSVSSFFVPSATWWIPPTP